MHVKILLESVERSETPIGFLQQIDFNVSIVIHGNNETPVSSQSVPPHQELSPSIQGEFRCHRPAGGASPSRGCLTWPMTGEEQLFLLLEGATLKRIA